MGAYKITPTHELLLNDNFRGLDVKDVKDPNHYQHFRSPQSEEKREFIGTILKFIVARDDALHKPNFLDPLVEDYPK